MKLVVLDSPQRQCFGTEGALADDGRLVDAGEVVCLNEEMLAAEIHVRIGDIGHNYDLLNILLQQHSVGNYHKLPMVDDLTVGICSCLAL